MAWGLKFRMGSGFVDTLVDLGFGFRVCDRSFLYTLGVEASSLMEVGKQSYILRIKMYKQYYNTNSNRNYNSKSM